MNDLDVFNFKFIELIRNPVRIEIELPSNEVVVEPVRRIFVCIADCEPISVTSLRVLFVAKFLTKFLKLSKYKNTSCLQV